MIRLPYGTSNFEKLVEQNYYFVDKTEFIEKLENYESGYIFFLRPRRFGKSLFLSVLDNYYDINKKSKFDVLFNKYYIGKHPTKKHNSYLILNFDFSGVNTENKKSVFTDFRFKILEGVKNFNIRYNITDDSIFNEIESPASILSLLFEEIRRKKMTNKVYILIDEYDHFTNEILGSNYELFEEIVTGTGFVRKFYESIKIGTKDIVDRLFVTGVTPVTVDSFTSGFNISSNLSMNFEFHNMMGFTGDETYQLIKLCVDGFDIDIDKVYQDMKNYYNGYLFNEECPDRLFNSNMVLYFLMDFKKTKKYPKNIVDDNVISDYGKIEQLFNIKPRENNYNILDELINKGEVSGQLTTKYTMQKSFDRDDFISLLFYLGILTIKGGDVEGIKFGIPNYVIKQLYLEFFLQVLKQQIDYEIDTKNISLAIKDIAINNNFQKFISEMELFLTKLSNRDYQKFDEKYIKLIFILLMNMSKAYYIKSEYETEGGYIDIFLKEQPQIKVNYQYMIEIKYIKKEDYSESALKIKKEEGSGQLLKYLATNEAKSMTNLKGYVIIFSGSESKLCECIN